MSGLTDMVSALLGRPNEAQQAEMQHHQQIVDALRGAYLKQHLDRISPFDQVLNPNFYNDQPTDQQQMRTLQQNYHSLPYLQQYQQQMEHDLQQPSLELAQPLKPKAI